MSSIITATDLTNFINKTVDSNIIEQTVDAINDYIESETHRCWGATKQITETHDWSRIVWLQHQDVISVDLIQVGFPNTTRTTLTSAAYWFNSRGRVTLFWQLLPATLLGGINTTSMMLNDYMSVEYTYGYHELGFDDNNVPLVPSDLKQAALGIAANFYNWAVNGQKDIVAAAIGSYRLEYAGRVRGSDNGNNPLNPSKNVLDAHFATINRYASRRQ